MTVGQFRREMGKKQCRNKSQTVKVRKYLERENKILKNQKFLNSNPEEAEDILNVGFRNFR